jgi:hypothetical protein
VPQAEQNRGATAEYSSAEPQWGQSSRMVDQ